MNTVIRVTLSTAVATALVVIGLANISYDQPTRGTMLQSITLPKFTLPLKNITLVP
jgi:hypothetical protein